MKKAVLILILTAWGSTSFAQTEDYLKTFEFTIEGMTCGGCAQSATLVLLDIPGVTRAQVTFENKKAVVIASHKLSEQQIKQAIKAKTNFEVLFPGDELVKPLTNEERGKVDLEVIKGGGKIKWKEHLSPGKLTIFDFYADWCGPCRVFSPKVEQLLLNYPSVALKKVDIVDWNSSLSKQLTQDYKMPALPFVLIFNDQGKLLSKVEGNHIEQVEQIIRQYEK